MRELLWVPAALCAAAFTGSASASIINYTSQIRSVEAMADVDGTMDDDSDSAVDFGPFPANAFAEVTIDMDEAIASASTSSSLDPLALGASGSVNASRTGESSSAEASSLLIVEFTLDDPELFDIAIGTTNTDWFISGPSGIIYDGGDTDLNLVNVPFEAGDYTVSFQTTASVDSEEGSQVDTGSWSVALTLVPAPGIPCLAGLAACVAMRRRR